MVYFNKQNTEESGFTIVELLTTIITATLFVGIFYQMFLILVNVNANAKNMTQASDLAYSNMRRYPTAASVITAGYTCTSVASQGGTALITNTTGTNSSYSDLGSVTETVAVSFPYGCTAVYDVVKLVSTVTYGGGLKISHATYVN